MFMCINCYSQLINLIKNHHLYVILINYNDCSSTTSGGDGGGGGDVEVILVFP